ncbi:MAG: hypothetical protein KDC98_16215 [Planctomycetes bacterium]|nr:hypothetical protein [Planctomycetota bacterium]
MRLSTLLTFSLCLAPLAAQHGFSQEQRAELREIIRSEIRAAIKEMHSSHATATTDNDGARLFGLLNRLESTTSKAEPRIVRAVHGTPATINEDVKVVLEGKGEVVGLDDITFGDHGKGSGQIVLELNDVTGECPGLDCHTAVVKKSGKNKGKNKDKKGAKKKGKKNLEVKNVEARAFKIDGGKLIEIGSGDGKAGGKGLGFSIGANGVDIGKLLRVHADKGGQGKAGKGNVMFFSNENGEGTMSFKIVGEGGEGIDIESPQILIECSEAKECCEEGEAKKCCEEGQPKECCEEACEAAEAKPAAKAIRVIKKISESDSEEQAALDTIDRVLKRIR